MNAHSGHGNIEGLVNHSTVSASPSFHAAVLNCDIHLLEGEVAIKLELNKIDSTVPSQADVCTVCRRTHHQEYEPSIGSS